MLRQLVNQCRMVARVQTIDPMAIKAGVANLRDIDAAFVRTLRDGQEEIYLPGSSLKGALRNRCERIARTLNEGSACDPFARSGPARSCGDILEEREHPRPGGARAGGAATTYRDSCLTCRLFGSTAMAGRTMLSDGHLAPDVLPVMAVRDGIGIDRFTGGAASRVRYEVEVVTDATFTFELELRNFDLAQLGLIGLALRDLFEGELRLGSGKSRGLGRLRGEVVSCDVAYVGARAPEDVPALLGAGQLWQGAAAYGFSTDDRLPIDGGTYERSGIRTHLRLPADGMPWASLCDHAAAAIEQYRVPRGMQQVRQGAPVTLPEPQQQPAAGRRTPNRERFTPPPRQPRDLGQTVRTLALTGVPGEDEALLADTESQAVGDAGPIPLPSGQQSDTNVTEGPGAETGGDATRAKDTRDEAERTPRVAGGAPAPVGEVAPDPASGHADQHGIAGEQEAAGGPEPTARASGSDTSGSSAASSPPEPWAQSTSSTHDEEQSNGE